MKLLVKKFVPSCIALDRVNKVQLLTAEVRNKVVPTHICSSGLLTVLRLFRGDHEPS
jgi:hypothetical protein